MKPFHSQSRPIEIQPASGDGWVPPAVRAWNRFWFRPADPLPLGVIRFLAGAVILYIHLIYSLDLQDLVGKHGWVDEQPLKYLRKEYLDYPPSADWDFSKPEKKGLPLWSVYYHVQEPASVIAVHSAFMVGMFLFTIGFATRVTSVIAWVAALSYVHRATSTVFGMDQISIILLFYLMIGPSGATFSVDRLLACWWARRKGLPEPPVKPMVSANFALRLMQVHFCIIYMASGLSKLQGPSWWNGQALWGTMANYSFAPMHWPIYLDFLRFLAEHRVLWEIVMTGGSYFTLVVEISFTFLVWRKSTRWLILIGAVMLHTGIGLIMGLTTFSMTMMCLMLCFLPPETFHRALTALSSKASALRGKALSDPRAARKEPALAGKA
ncbi:MAG TPA: HTTM domain-containing protein [Gemmataceae bacterium]|nr:HTTM domain-containing protein [Gemmataceae bacterium]